MLGRELGVFELQSPETLEMLYKYINREYHVSPG